MTARALLAVVLVQFATVACRPAESPNGATAANAAVIRGLYDSFAKGDLPAVMGNMDSSVTWNEADGILYADGNPYVGPDAVVKGVFQRLGADIENFQALPTNFIADDRRVAVEGRYKGVMKATAVPIDAQFAHFWELRDGKIVRFQQYTDTRQWEGARVVVTR